MGLFGGLRSYEALRADIESLLKDHLLKLLTSAFNAAMMKNNNNNNKLPPSAAGYDNAQLLAGTRAQSQTYSNDDASSCCFKDKLLSLSVIFSCMLHNKLLTSKTLPGFIETELISNASGFFDKNKIHNTTGTMI